MGADVIDVRGKFGVKYRVAYASNLASIVYS